MFQKLKDQMEKEKKQKRKGKERGDRKRNFLPTQTRANSSSIFIGNWINMIKGLTKLTFI